MAKEEVPEDVKKILEEEGVTAEELLEAKKAHKKKMKRLDRQLSAARAERVVEVE